MQAICKWLAMMINLSYSPTSRETRKHSKFRMTPQGRARAHVSAWDS